MQAKILMAILLLCCVGCKSKTIQLEKFDKLKWATMQNGEYLYRNKMITDLLENYTLKGVKQDSILNMLGEPNRRDSLYLFYIVDQKLFANFFPLYTKSLVIKLAGDSTVEWRKIHE